MDARLSFAFVMNRMVATLTGDARTLALGGAVVRSLAG
jgi:hypothetical protein